MEEVAEYFEQVLNVADVREAIISVVGNWPMLGDFNGRAISLVEVRLQGLMDFQLDV